MANRLLIETKVNEECNHYNNVLNNVVGLMLLNLGVACVGTPNPQKMALVGLIVVAPVLLYATRQFSPIVKKLRMEKKAGNKSSAILLQFINKKHLGVKSLLSDCPIYFVSTLFYFSVLLFPKFTEWIKLP